MTTAAQPDWKSLHGDHFRGQRVLVTGGAGFIGSHLVDALLALQARVVVLDDLSGGSRTNLQPEAEFVQGTLLDDAKLAGVVSGCRYVFHLAALGSVPRSVEQPALYHDVNTTGTLRVLEAARKAGVARVMFAASSSAYGTNPVPWEESMPVLPASPYAATKVAGEALCRAYAASLGVDTAPLRYFNIFGPRQNANSAYAAVIAAFAKALLSGRPATIYGDGSQTRDFTYVANAVHANLLAARSNRPIGGEVINVGTGGQTSVTQLHGRMATLLGKPDARPEHRPERAGDLKHSFAHLARPRDLLGYEPVVDFESGLAETLRWYRQQHERSAGR
jgi:nucleoside-diphosphate-sugar epimerase